MEPSEAATTLLTKILKDSGYSLTTARRLVFQLLWQREPQTMLELCQASAGRIDRASIYRSIDIFQRLGLVQRITMGWKYKLELSDIFSHHHHHISCLGCGKVVAIKEDDAIEAMIKRFADTYHITAEQHQLEIQGYCQACRT